LLQCFFGIRPTERSSETNTNPASTGRTVSSNMSNPDPFVLTQAHETPIEEDSDEKSAQFAATPDSDSEKFVIDRKAERALVRRLDLIFLSVAGLGYIFKYLDQTNIVRLTDAGRSGLTPRAMPTCLA